MFHIFIPIHLISVSIPIIIPFTIASQREAKSFHQMSMNGKTGEFKNDSE